MRLHVLDTAMRPVPQGVVGELYVGGSGVSLGYWGRPELTAGRFVPDPFSEGGTERLYRSGDLARRRAGGEIEYIGRSDRQVQLRGFRIELGEIEAVLLAQPGVAAALVLVHGEMVEDRRLVAWLVARPGARIDADISIAEAGKVLPPHMVPTAIIPIEALPLTPSGKLDRDALPAPTDRRFATRRRLVPPRTATETDLLAIWQSLLKVKEIGVEDRFFELGGNSLQATQMASRIRDRFGVEIPLAQLFEASTIAAHAGFIDQAHAAIAAPPAEPADAEHEEFEL
jgi:acyl carrier protein